MFFCKYKITEKENIFSFFRQLGDAIQFDWHFRKLLLTIKKPNFQISNKKKKTFQSICEIHFRETKWDEIGFRFYLRQSQWTYGGSLAVSIIVAACVLPSFLLCSSHSLIQKNEKRLKKMTTKLGKTDESKCSNFTLTYLKLKIQRIVKHTLWIYFNISFNIEWK